MEWKKGLISGIVVGVVLNVLGFVLSTVFGTSEWYSANFPQMMSPGGMYAMVLSMLVMGVVMGLVYSVINSAVPGDGMRKGINYGIMVWLLAGLMWPIMMMGFASAYNWIVELIIGVIEYSIAGAVLVVIYEKV